MAIAMPPRVIVLIVMPQASMARIATTKESGMAVREMNVVRKFQRKRNSTTVTMIPPSMIESRTFVTARLIKSAC